MRALLFLCPAGIKNTRPDSLVGSLTKDAAERGLALFGEVKHCTTFVESVEKVMMEIDAL